MLPRLDRLSLRRASARTDAPKRSFDDIMNSVEALTERPRGNNNREAGPSSAGASGPSAPAQAPPPPPPAAQGPSERDITQLLARFFPDPMGEPQRNTWFCRNPQCPDPHLGFYVELNGDGVETQYCKACDTPAASFASEDQRNWGDGDAMADEAQRIQRETRETEEVMRRQGAKITLRDVYPNERNARILNNPDEDEQRLLRMANLRLSQTMIWLRLLAETNHEVMEVLGIALTTNEIALARDLVRAAVIQMVRQGGPPAQSDTTRQWGNPLFWAIAVAREVVARRDVGFAFYTRSGLEHEYTMRGILAYLERCVKFAMLADESQVTATRTGKGQQNAQRKLDEGKWRKPRWYGLGSTKWRVKNKLKYLNELLDAAEAVDEALHATTMDPNSAPAILRPFETDAQKRAREEREAREKRSIVVKLPGAKKRVVDVDSDEEDAFVPEELPQQKVSVEVDSDDEDEFVPEVVEQREAAPEEEAAEEAEQEAEEAEEDESIWEKSSEDESEDESHYEEEDEEYESEAEINYEYEYEYE